MHSGGLAIHEVVQQPVSERTVKISEGAEFKFRQMSDMGGQSERGGAPLGACRRNREFA